MKMPFFGRQTINKRSVIQIDYYGNLVFLHHRLHGEHISSPRDAAGPIPSAVTETLHCQRLHALRTRDAAPPQHMLRSQQGYPQTPTVPFFFFRRSTFCSFTYTFVYLDVILIRNLVNRILLPFVTGIISTVMDQTI